MLSMMLVIATYFYFNWQYFNFVSVSIKTKKGGKALVLTCFFVNLISFYFFSYLQLPLIINWTLFLVLLFAENLWIFRCKLPVGLFFSLQGVICGLTANILNRCLTAILFDVPLNVFDNNIMQEGNQKIYPIIAGFFFTGIVFHVFSKKENSYEIHLILHYPYHLRFLLRLMGVMFAFLLLNLLLYNSDQDAIILKLWGIESSIFVSIGYYIGLQFAIRNSQLSRYREQNREMRREVTSQKLEEERLYSAAFRDALTGLYNRKFAQKIVSDTMKEKERFSLAFIDLNGLKNVNDQFGHSAGDDYLLAVSEELTTFCRKGEDLLFRYGGDEFLLMFVGVENVLAKQRMSIVNEHLMQRSFSEEYPFSMSVSYGVVFSEQAQDAERLIALADKEMYRQKKERAYERN